MECRLLIIKAEITKNEENEAQKGKKFEIIRQKRKFRTDKKTL